MDRVSKVQKVTDILIAKTELKLTVTLWITCKRYRVPMALLLPRPRQ
jgi:hypothetical protein